MNRNLYIYKCGEILKAVSVQAKNDNCIHNNDKKIKNVNNNEKLFNNIIRAKSTIKDLILCNDFTFFVTLTINNNHDRFNLDKIRLSINNKIRLTRKKYNLELKFLLVPEKHQNGAWHLHGCFSKDFEQFMYINKNNYLSCSLFDYLGFSSIGFIDYKDKVSSYILKYVSKEFTDREKGKHLYFCSQNLNKPVLLDKIEYNNYELDKIFRFKNDFCYCDYFNNLGFLYKYLK